MDRGVWTEEDTQKQKAALAEEERIYGSLPDYEMDAWTELGMLP